MAGNQVVAGNFVTSLFKIVLPFFVGITLINDVKRLKVLESENTRLKKMVAERDLEIEVMKEIAAKKW